MSGDVLGGGLVVVVAAVLWLAYLIPNWVQRREYLATERNVVRLQQTLRILAETAEVPEEVRLEASARDVAAQQRMLREVERRRRADTWLQLRAARVANVRPSAPVAAAARAAAQRPLALKRRRRGRIATTVVLTVGLVAAGFGVAQLVAIGSWGLLAAGALLVVAAVAMLRRLARPLLAGAVGEAPRASAPVFDHAEYAEAAVAAVSREWTPQPLPKPLHLSKGSAAAGVMASVDAAAELRRALARSQMELRAAERAALAAQAVPPPPAAEPQPARIPAASAPPSRFAAMGVVDDPPPAAIDLNEVLRRRRAV